MEWLKGQAELEGPEEVKDMVSACNRWERIEMDLCSFWVGV